MHTIRYAAPAARYERPAEFIAREAKALAEVRNAARRDRQMRLINNALFVFASCIAATLGVLPVLFVYV